MTQYLPANLLALFTARPPITFKPPPDGLKKRKNERPYDGICEFMKNFETTEPPPATRGETRLEKEERKKVENKARCEADLQERLLRWDPHTDTNAMGDPFKTLYVARINYDTTESKLRRELESYGPIKRIYLVYSRHSRRPRGYAFVEYEHERDMHSAYKHADGKKIDGRRILVDVERGRTVKSWRPRRLGGGLGGTRRGGPDENIRHSGRVEQWESRGGGGDGDRDREERRERRRSRSPRERRDRERGERGERAERGERGERERGERERGERERGERRRDRDRDRERDRDRDRDRDREERDDRRRDKDRDRRDRDRERRDPAERENREREREERPNGREEEGEIKVEEESGEESKSYPPVENEERRFQEQEFNGTVIKEEPMDD